jgi:hypothetical protein
VAPESGQELWRYAFSASVPTAIGPVIAEDLIYHSAAYGVGARVARITRSGVAFQAVELWRKRGDLINFWSTPVVYQGHLYGLYGQDYGVSAPLKCVELTTGVEKWSQPGFGPGQVLLVDGTLLLLTADGKLILVAPTPIAYQELARHQVLNGKCWNTPAISRGRVYARSTKEGVCLDLSPPPPAPLRILVPTAQPDGGLWFQLACTDGSIPTAERLERIEVLASESPDASLADWISLGTAAVSSNGVVQVPPADDIFQQCYYTIREPR